MCMADSKWIYKYLSQGRGKQKLPGLPLLLVTPPLWAPTHPGASRHLGPPSPAHPPLVSAVCLARSLLGPHQLCCSCAPRAHPQPTGPFAPPPPPHLPSSRCSAPAHLPSRCCPPSDSTAGPRGRGGEGVWAWGAGQEAEARAAVGGMKELRSKLPAHPPSGPLCGALLPSPSIRALGHTDYPPRGLTPGSCPCKHSPDFLP